MSSLPSVADYSSNVLLKKQFRTFDKSRFFVNPTINVERFIRIYAELTPLSSIYEDSEGWRVQLWKTGSYGLIGAVFNQQDQLYIIPGKKIRNPLNDKQTSSELIECLEKAPDFQWDIVYDTHQLALTIWPHLQAAGREDTRSLVSKKLSKLETGQQKAVKIQTLPDGRIRYYGREKLSSKPGPTRGSCYVTEYNPKRGTVRSWYESHDHKGRVNRVHLKAINGTDVIAQHYPPTRKELERMNANKQESSAKNPANKNFQEVLQQTKLTDSYNTTHRGNPVPAKGGTGGTIGGVACGVDYIEGLFEGAETVFEKDHYFCVPLIDGQIPFSQEQLRQILRELAIAIYAHGAVPFFSLHFNQNAELFSVMNPAYQNTLVGRVIGMLDYFMKGYLNGGVFKEEFIDNWKPKPKEKRQPSMVELLYNWWWPPTSSNAQNSSPLDKLIDFEEYCQLHLEGEDKKYISVRGMQQELKVRGLLQRLTMTLNKEEPKELSDFDGFKNSFRIIAKQNSFQKEDNLFVIDADFDVFYTIEPSPIYQEKLEEYFRKHGEMPASYLELITAYELMSKKIHDHMVKMPMCREYFAMLGVINFFSSYFSTLKKHHKLPELSAFEKIDTRGCPPLFPHLPLSTSATEFVRTNKHVVLTNSLKNKEQLMKSGFAQLYDHLMNNRRLESFDKGETQVLYNIILKELESNVFDLSSPPFKRFLLKNKEKLVLAFEGPAKTMLNILFKNFEQTIAFDKRIPQRQRTPKLELINYFLSAICQRIPNEIEAISEELSYHSLFNANIVSTEELEKNKRIVGGCGMRLEKQKVQSSSKASFILENNHLPLDPETWEKVNMGTSEGAVFRLGMEDIPHGIIGDYSWMESLLQEKTEPEFVQSWVEIQQAIELGDHEEFKKCVDAVADLTKIKGPNKTSLLHMTAKIEDFFYTQYLLKNPYFMYWSFDKPETASA